MALRGAGGPLEQIDYVCTEVNREAVFIGAPMVEGIDWTGRGWGDRFYVRLPIPQWRNPCRLLPMRV